jgi:hypothetical protein
LETATPNADSSLAAGRVPAIKERKYLLRAPKSLERQAVKTVEDSDTEPIGAQEEC